MPTARRRHVITESDSVAAAVDDAALRWPEDAGNRARLLLRLVEEGHQAVAAQREDEVRGRRQALAETSGSLIAHFDESDVHHGAARVLDLAAHALVVSPITLAEFFVGPTRANAKLQARDGVARIGVEVIPLPEDAPARLALLRVETGLKLPDCCVLLAAEQTGAGIATFDDRLATAARTRGLIVVG